MKQHYIIPGLLGLVSLYWLYMSIYSYGVWNEEGPLGGFMPMLAALVTLGFSLAALLRKAPAPKPWFFTVFIPVGMVAVLVGMVQIIGMLPALFVMVLAWFKGLERYSWIFSLIMSACIIGVVWLVFEAWLRVPFPTGLF